MAQTLIEKIVQNHAVGLEKGYLVKSGDFISIQPAHVMTHDNTGAVMGKFEAIGANKMANPRQPVFTLDHNVQDKSESNKKKYQRIEAFGKKMGVDFYPAGRGIGHQIMCEEGYAWPGTMAVASDSHSNMYGGLGCLGTPVVRTDAAALWATSRTWWQVPPIVNVILKGNLQKGVTGKDIIITLCGLFNKDEVLNHVLEFTGDGVTHLGIDERLSIANMTTEWGALAGVFPIDNTLINWLKKRDDFITSRGLEGVISDEDAQDGVHPRINHKTIEELIRNHPTADSDAYYAKEVILDLDSICPHISGPNNVKTMTNVNDAFDKDIKINKAYLVSCVNSRVEDLAEAAKTIKNKTIAPGVEFYIAAASSEVQAESEARGDWQDLINAGATPLPPGCGPCIGLGAGLLGPNEIGISATNRNFKGRMGDPSAEAYLASPAVVAASAVAGKIAPPFEFKNIKPNGTIVEKEKNKSEKINISLLSGFPENLSGKIILCYQDNLNTDGIYPGKYTYVDDFTPEQMAEVVMENYDMEFTNLVEKGNIIVGGYNFGTGSSREQAATALMYRGIQMVIAGSFSQTYKRNAINNGFLVLESPELLEDLKNNFGTKSLTVKTELDLLVDFKKSCLTVNDKDYQISPVGAAAQELIITKGLENWVKENID
ncbi:MAG: homoaconitase [Lentimicrobiaceae bacterium]|nr:homoaconitase [Lentimicrobiaceae bacterium]MBT4189887.1 homoaconitase [Lentimicrobiaceae bacterium]MCP4909811.1 homoaconitase [Bacteroidota bacterium]